VSGESPNIRLFVAIHPPLEARESYLALLKSLGPQVDPRRRETPLEQVHLTLQFIGQVPGRDLPRITESVKRSASGIAPFWLTPLRLITLPERGTPRLIALELDAPAPLLEIRTRLVKRLARSVREHGAERFRPHMTLCRFAPDASPKRLGQAVSLPRFNVDAVVLFRSVLKPGGAEHSDVARAGLGSL
jgi:RNA 2',3'-cyclic 3'-phosphodiesterase